MGLYSDLTLSDTPYIPQYQGLPLETIRETSDTLAQRHYQNLSNLSQLELLARQQKTQVLPGHQGYVDTQIAGIKAGLDDIAKSGGENATAKVAAMVNAYRGDPTILQSMQRRGEIQKEIDAESTLRAQGKTPIRREGVRERFLSGQISPDELSQPYQSTVESYVEPVPEMEEIWKVVNPDAWFSSLQPEEQSKLSKLIGTGAITPSMDLPLFLKTVRSQGISTDKIENMLNSAMSSYRLQPSYRQQTDLLGQSEDQVRRRLLNQGLLRVFNQASPQYYRTPFGSGKSKTEMPIFQEGLPGEGVENEWGYSIDAFDPSSKDSVFGRINTGTTAEKIAEAKKYRELGFKVEPAGSGGTTGGIYDYVVKATENSDITAHPKYEEYKKDALAAAEVFIPGAQDWDDETKEQYVKGSDAAANLRKYQEEFENRLVNARLIPFNPDQVKEVSTHVKNNLYNRTIYDLDEGKVLQVFDNNRKLSDRFSDLLGDADLEKFKVTGRHNPKNFNTQSAGPEFYEGLEGFIYDKKADTYKRVLISPAAGELDTQLGNVKSLISQTYSTLGKKPGQWQEITPMLRMRGKYVSSTPIEARELYGEQRNRFIDNLDSDDQRQLAAQYPNLIEVKVDGDTMVFDSYEQLSQYLIKQPAK